MASSIAASKLHMRRSDCLFKSLQKVQTIFRRHIGKNVVAAKSQALQKDETDENDGHRSLHAVQALRQEQAERSVLIGCPSRVNEKKFLNYLSRHGNINKCFFFESYGIYAVAEFANREGVMSLLEEAVVPSLSHEAVVPFKSRQLSVKNLGSPDTSDLQALPQTTIHINELIQRLSRELSIDQQVISLTEAYKITEENIRLRFLVCSLLQDITAAYFPECSIKPFGSSMNGFGRLGSDLDMILDLDGISRRTAKMTKSGLCMEFQVKRASSERAVTQSILSVIGECLDQFGPGCVGMQKILNARCPLIRFSHQPTGFQCDLTVSNRVAVKSTELLYLYGELDPRVRFLVFTVRCWARAHGITSSIPGAWITNFSLTIMVLFFLQRRRPPIIPTLNHLKDLADPADMSVIEGYDCTFVSDFSRIKLQRNTETLEHLLREFFEFYATFPFSKKSINIRKGNEQNKPEVAPLHIQNPFEISLNVTKNVNATQLERFVSLCQESSWLLQQYDTNTPSGGKGGDAPIPWGLATLLLPSKVAAVTSRKKKRQEPASERIKSLLSSLNKSNETK